MARLLEFYKEEVIQKLQKQFNYTSIMQVPKISKITLNMGLGEAMDDKKILDLAMDDMAKIAGQKPIRTIARKSIAGFKLRENWAIGCKVTLRRKKMYEFLDRLITVALPRVRDFRGISVKSFDGRGNFSFGIKEQIVFPDIDYDRIDKLRGLDITITTTAQTNKEAQALLEAFSFPFKEKA